MEVSVASYHHLDNIMDRGLNEAGIDGALQFRQSGSKISEALARNLDHGITEG